MYDRIGHSKGTRELAKEVKGKVEKEKGKRKEDVQFRKGYRAC